MNPQEYQILQDNKFNLYCSVLGVKEQCCFAPDKKVIERAFRKSALKCHPDKGGDPVVFKKLNEAYNKLIGHIGKLEQQTEAIELANSILIEISKTSVVKWHEKLKTRYGWFKTDNCKNIIFDGPYKQYMGRSKNTGNITVVLYEDPPDQIPKIHVRSSKYMAWIAEQMMPVHMHVEKGKTIQFDQWRIAHLAEFGICNFMSATPPTPAPEKKEPKPKPKTPKAKRREAREASERRAKTRRDSEPTPEPGEKTTGSENNKENTEPKPSEDDLNGKDMEEDEDVQQNPVIEEKPFNCGHCGEGFNNLMDYALHKKICVPDEDFGFASGMQDVINNQYKTEKKVGFAENLEKSKSAPESKKEEHSNPSQKAQASSKAQEKKLPNSPTFQCEKCDEKFTNMVWYAKHKNACQIGKCTEPEATSTSDPVSERNTKCEEEESKSSKNIPTKVNISEEPQKQSSPQKHSKSSSMTNGQNDKSNNDINQKTTKEEVLTTRKEYKDTKIDIPMPPFVDNKVKEKSENKNEGIKTGHNVKNDNDSSQNTSKENILPTPKEPKKDTEKKLKENIIPTQNNVKDMEVDSSVQQPNKNKVEDITPKKSNPGMKTGKVTKPAKAAKLNGTLNKDDFDPKKKPETKTSVEAMDIDEPEIKKAETPKTTPKKNDMPMGSLLTNLPTTAKPPPTADLNSKSPPKMAPAKAKRCSMVYVVGPNTFAGNPQAVRTIKHSASSPGATLHSNKTQKVN